MQTHALPLQKVRYQLYGDSSSKMDIRGKLSVDKKAK
jgi:hypothetical protein